MIPPSLIVIGASKSIDSSSKLYRSVNVSSLSKCRDSKHKFISGSTPKLLLSCNKSLPFKLLIDTLPTNLSKSYI